MAAISFDKNVNSFQKFSQYKKLLLNQAVIKQLATRNITVSMIEVQDNQKAVYHLWFDHFAILQSISEYFDNWFFELEVSWTDIYILSSHKLNLKSWIFICEKSDGEKIFVF